MKSIILVGLTVAFIILISNSSNATDCDANCEKHFDKWYQKPDLLRCKAERYAACKWGIEHCDFHSRDFNIAVDIIQQAHNKKNNPKDVHQCYQYIDNGSLAHSIGEKGVQLYNIINGISSKFNPYAIIAKEISKQIARCACKKVEWKQAGGGQRPNPPVIRPERPCPAGQDRQRCGHCWPKNKICP